MTATLPLAAALEPADVLAWVGDPSGVGVSRVDHDSRSVERGSLFCCIPGDVVDGHDYAPDAVARGAVGLVVERSLVLDDVAVPQAVVASVRAAIGPVAARVAGDPSHHLDVIGVTGTNGKTTVTHLLGAILGATHGPTEVLGTLSGARTTPEAPELQRFLAAARDGGAAAVAMEVSSHALDMRRVDGTRFAVAAFTNLSRDHLDHHGSMESYFEAKARLFTPALARLAVIDVDDPYGRRLADIAALPVVRCSLADLVDVEVGMAGSVFGWRGHRVRLPLGGRFNVRNAHLAAEVAIALGARADEVAAALGAPVTVPGRFEHIDAGQPFDVVVDYAHTPDGLEQVLAAAGEAGARVLVVFGCGGDRDPTKRAPMGAAAVRGADVVIVTADNSRSEPTGSIVAAVLAGIDAEPSPRATDVEVIEDRRAAIAAAIGRARPGDVVVVAGKGHETTQVVGSTVTRHDDRQVAREALGALGFGAASEVTR